MTDLSGPQQPPKKRRVRYSGKNPRHFDEKYKEHDPVRYPDDVAKVIQSGKTPAGMHRPVLVAEVLEALRPVPGDTVLDATLGYGGHAFALLESIKPEGCLWGIDADPVEIVRTEARLRAAGFDERTFKVRRINFAGIAKVAAEAGGGFDCILADLGISSMQLDDPARGFTFKREGPLDLRLNPGRGQAGSQLLASLSEKDIEQMLQVNADEPYAYGIAQAIFKGRDRMLTTTALAEAVRRGLPPRGSSGGTKEDEDRSIRRTFQALRIAVNNEFFVLEQFLKDLPACLKPGGRVAVLTFHSGEDRRVVRSFEEGVAAGVFAETGKSPIFASLQEQHDNPRSKSAILRWAVATTPDPAG